jgi:protein-L-isoaspartate(D-aspartate) O-methyltransferase
VGGMMVIPLSENENSQTMLRLTKQEDGSMKREEYGDFRFVPMLKNLGDD